ncbi:hypothetical protein GCM10008965_31360 [Methylorubrum aminovorans]|nr:hypothetical protein GCM10025880_14110 [Methylorubrum aminovorans]
MPPDATIRNDARGYVFEHIYEASCGPECASWLNVVSHQLHGSTDVERAPKGDQMGLASNLGRRVADSHIEAPMLPLKPGPQSTDLNAGCVGNLGQRVSRIIQHEST